MWNRCWHHRHIEKHLNRVAMCQLVRVWLCAFVNTFEWLISKPGSLCKPVRCGERDGEFKKQMRSSTFFSPFLSLWNTCSHTLHLTELHVPWDDCESSFKSKCVYLCVLEKEGEVCTWHTERVFWCLGKMAHWVCVCVLYPVCVTFVKCAWVPIKVLTFCVCACVCESN